MCKSEKQNGEWRNKKFELKFANKPKLTERIEMRQLLGRNYQTRIIEMNKWINGNKTNSKYILGGGPPMWGRN